MKKIDLKKYLKFTQIDITFIINILVTAIFILFLVKTPESIDLDRLFDVIEKEHLLKELLILLVGSFVWFQMFQFIYFGEKYDN